MVHSVERFWNINGTNIDCTITRDIIIHYTSYRVNGMRGTQSMFKANVAFDNNQKWKLAETIMKHLSVSPDSCNDREISEFIEMSN